MQWHEDSDRSSLPKTVEIQRKMLYFEWQGERAVIDNKNIEQTFIFIVVEFESESVGIPQIEIKNSWAVEG